MTVLGWSQIAIVLLLVLAGAWPMSQLIHSVYLGERNFLSPVLRPVETVFYRLAGVDEKLHVAFVTAAYPTRRDETVLMIPLRDEQGDVTGGLWGHTLFQWLSIEMLIVPDDRRGQGIGSALVASAETEARARGCIGAVVDTFSFQAKSFYQRLGFTVLGVLDDYPPGYSRIYFRKRWDQPA